MKCTAFCQLLPSLVAAHSIQSIYLEGFEDGTHPGPCRLCIGQDVAALLRVNARDTVPFCCQLAASRQTRADSRGRFLQQIARQTERHGRHRLYDGVTRLDYVHVKDGFARDLLQSRFRAKRGDEPGWRVVSY